MSGLAQNKYLGVSKTSHTASPAPSSSRVGDVETKVRESDCQRQTQTEEAECCETHESGMGKAWNSNRDRGWPSAGQWGARPGANLAEVADHSGLPELSLQV